VRALDDSRIIVSMPANGGDAPDIRRRRLISPRDIAMVFYLAALLVPAWTLPDRWLTLPGRLIALTTVRMRPARTRRDAARLRRLFGERMPASATRLHTEILTNAHVHTMLYLRALRPGGWTPTTHVEGAEHLRSALNDGRGVVVWTAPLSYDGLMTKVALSAAGAPPGHLSHLYHYLSDSRFGVRFLNGLVRHVEARYIADRFVMRPEGATAALRGLREHVARNGVVTVTGIGGAGGRMYTAALLDGTIELPTSAPELARRAGACLVSATTVRNDDGSFVTYVDPLAAGASDRGRADAAAFADIIARRILEHPGQCSPMLYRELPAT